MEILPSDAPRAVPRPASGLDFPVVGIGASAGGLGALKTLFLGLPATPDMAFVVVLHLSPDHESSLAAILQHATKMPVAQVQTSVKIERNHVYVIPPGHDLEMVDGSLSLAPSQRRGGRQVTIDHFFRALARAHGERAIGIVLSGTGSDGAAGIASLKEHGGVIIAQSPQDAEFDGMPKSTIATGKVDIVLPVSEIPERLVGLWRNARRIELPGAARSGLAVHQADAQEAAEAALREIMRTLEQRTGYDFSAYKRATVLRRLERRMQVSGVADLQSYSEHLNGEAGESRALLDDMLIGVTQFFRDAGPFDALDRLVPSLFEGLGEREGVRAWVPGCSSGEEAYSIAMLLAEEAERLGKGAAFTVFASDIDERALAAGRAGLYPEAIAGDVGPTRLRDHFDMVLHGYRVRKPLREKVIFAVHSVLRDPPFSRLDLIACRNLLIYLDPPAQRSVLEMFHFALRPGGHLFLGTSETVDVAARLFTPVDKAARLYRATPASRAWPALPAATSAFERRWQRPAIGGSLPPPPKPAEVHQELLERFALPSVLTTSEHEVVHVSDRAARYLRYEPGEPSHNLLRYVLPELRPELRSALFQATKVHDRVDCAPVRTIRDGHWVVLRMSVRPVHHAFWPGEMLLVFFEESDGLGDGTVGPTEGSPESPLELQLQRRSEQLRTTVEQYEASAEALKASNEELQSINEELRSTTEELETSKEELQSTNEELITVNHELKSKIDELNEANDNLKNLIESTDIATVFVDSDLRIRHFTPAAAALFNVIAADVGRGLFDLTHKLHYPELASDMQSVYRSLASVEREVKGVDGREHLARVSPFRTTENRIGGVVLSFVDVTRLRGAEAAVRSGRERIALMAESTIDYAIMTLDAGGEIETWNVGAERLFGWSGEEAKGQQIGLIFTAEDRAAGVPEAEMAAALAAGRAPDDRWLQKKDGTTFFASGVLTELRAPGMSGFAKICHDATPLVAADEQRNQQLAAARQGVAAAAAEGALKNQFLAVMSHELKHPLNLINVNAQLLMTLPDVQRLEPVMRAARTIQRTVQSQARIIDDLLDMSRVQTGKLTLNRSPVVLNEAVQPSMTWALAETRAKGVRLYAEGFDEPLAVDGDPVRIEQIAWNLLSNAIKFSRTGGTIRVELRRDGAEALIEVVDTGRGVSPAFLPHVFEMFRQADSAMTRSEGGLGIGLALVKSLAELHGGRAEATSEGVGRGATFRVWLPLHQDTGLGTLDGLTGIASRSLKDARILLVDDTQDTLDTFGMLLEAEGALVTTATSGAEALGLCEGADFDLIVSDIGMPQMDGCEMLIELRSRQRNGAVPALALSGYGRTQDVTRALASGFQAQANKPVDYALLRELMATLLSAGSTAVAAAGVGGK